MNELSPRGTDAAGLRDLQNRPRLSGPPPDDFRPLRLVLVPSGWSVTLDRVDVILGRHSSADVRLPLPDVSRRHCRFLWLDDTWQVVDLGSLNGIKVNDVAVQHATLKAGDTMRIGGFTFRIELLRGLTPGRAPITVGPARLAS
jgi:pSer/pThr/pTyr-binding forkhead associated (FHA) protein